jgi:hypothetical protein
MIRIVRLVAQSDRSTKGGQASTEIRNRRRGCEGGEIGRHFIKFNDSGEVARLFRIVAGVGEKRSCGVNGNECDNTRDTQRKELKLAVRTKKKAQ